MKEFLETVNTCNDIQVVKNVVSILVDGMEIGMNDAAILETLKCAYSELADCHYTEELAKLYYSGNGIDVKVWDAAKLAYTQEIQVSYPDVPLYDWVVLYGRMSQNTKGTDAIVEACKVFLDNKFIPYFDID